MTIPPLHPLPTQPASDAVGGSTGSDPPPTLAEFQSYVAAGAIRYFIGGDAGGAGRGSGTANRTATWVTAHYHRTTVGGVTVYDLTSPTTG